MGKRDVAYNELINDLLLAMTIKMILAISVYVTVIYFVFNAFFSEWRDHD